MLREDGICEELIKTVENNYISKTKIKEGFRFPTYLPLKMLKDLKEGEKITLTYKTGKQVELTAQQLGVRYENHGSFDVVLKKLMAKKGLE